MEPILDDFGLRKLVMRSGVGYQHASTAAREHGRFPVASRPSSPNVSFPSYCVSLPSGCGPTIGGAPTAAGDPMYGPAAFRKREFCRISEVADMYPAFYEANVVKGMLWVPRQLV